ncbi:hypothetical protein A0H81_02133 [Grifola frondosa]|uniref:Uncharacterized protein n=1 Tax=Grifola frondosa TaxID=5627 RepID=A0A1C7MM21_GRIFR|nr:hypothetical protein A0H81_02133 [Grifola frondosa]
MLAFRLTSAIRRPSPALAWGLPTSATGLQILTTVSHKYHSSTYQRRPCRLNLTTITLWSKSFSHQRNEAVGPKLPVVAELCLWHLRTRDPRFTSLEGPPCLFSSVPTDTRPNPGKDRYRLTACGSVNKWGRLEACSELVANNDALLTMSRVRELSSPEPG